MSEKYLELCHECHIVVSSEPVFHEHLLIIGEAIEIPLLDT
jgi:hypothetical protein